MQSPISQLDTDTLLKKDIAALVRMRMFRRQYDQRRLFFYRQYISQRDQSYFPDKVTPRSNTFVPYPQSNVEDIVGRVMSAIFGFDPWFDAKPSFGAADPSASAMQRVLHDKLHKANFKANFESFIRNVAIYGHAALKVDWNWDYETVHSKKPVIAHQTITDPQTGQQAQQPIVNPMTGEPQITGYQMVTERVPKACPRIIPIDIYDFLVDPDTQVMAHLTERTLGDIEREHTANPKLYFDEGVAEIGRRIRAANPDNPEGTIVRLAELWKNYDQTVTVMTFSDDNDAISWKDARAAVRAANISGFERKAFSGPPILLWHGPNQFKHQRIPILTANFIKLPNEIFGLGAVEIISDLTEALNRFVNMVADNWNLGINKRYAFDTNADIDHEALNSFNVPGSKVGVNGNPEAVLFPLPNFTPSPGDYSIIEMYQQMLQMTSGVSDAYAKGAGGPGAGGATASGISQVLASSGIRIDSFIRTLAQDVMVPLLEMCASMVMQFISNEQEMEVTGAQQAFITKYPDVSPQELIGTYEFTMTAGPYATNKLVRQRNMLAFANLAAQSPYVNQYEGLKELGKVMEIPHMERLLRGPQEVQQEQASSEQKQLQMAFLQHFFQMDQAELNHPKDLGTEGAEGTGPGQGVGGGRPRTKNLEGPIPGTQYTNLIRELAQSVGKTAMGQAGLDPNVSTQPS